MNDSYEDQVCCCYIFDHLHQNKPGRTKPLSASLNEWFIRRWRSPGWSSKDLKDEVSHQDLDHPEENIRSSRPGYLNGNKL